MKIPRVARARLAYQWVRLLRNPLDTERVFNMADIGIEEINKNPELFADITQQLSSIEGFDALYQEKYFPSIALDQLQALPTGTFGHAIYHHYQNHNLDPDFYKSVEITNPLSYASELTRRSHDLWHTALGRGVTFVDEVYIQSFAVGQSGDPLGAAIVAGGILHAILQKPEDITRCFAEVCAGYALGKEAKPFVGLRWDDYFGLPLEEVRQAIGVASLNRAS